MKKLIFAVVILAVVLLVAPYGVGKVAEKRLNHGLDILVREAPYLTIVERKYTGGLFTSEQVVTFEVLADLLKAVESEFEDAAQGDGVEADLSDDGTEPALAEGAPKPKEKVRFKVRNQLLHGPVLGMSSFGVAQVDTSFELPDEYGKKVEELFGPKALFEITTRIGFVGNATTTFKSEGRSIQPKGSTAVVAWDTFKLVVGYSKNLDGYEFDGTLPKLEIYDNTEESQYVLTNVTMNGDGKRVLGSLYDGDFDFGIEKLSSAHGGTEGFAVSDLHYITNIETKAGFSSMNIRMGSGEVKWKSLAAMGINLREFHYEIGLRHAHAPTLEKILAGYMTMTAVDPAKALDSGEDVTEPPIQEHGMELLKYDPEFVVDRIGIVTPEGDGFIRGVVKIQGATAEDFEVGNVAFIPRIDARFTVDVSEKMVQKMINGSTLAGAAVDSGYATRDRNRLISKVVFSRGALTINGKPQAIPGLGGPPGGGMEEAPPPQE